MSQDRIPIVGRRLRQYDREQQREMAQSVDDDRIQKAIQRKRTISQRERPGSLGCLDVPMIRKFIDHFLIIGVPPDADVTKDPEPQILYLYPPSPSLLESSDIMQTVKFGFPDGVHPHGKTFSHKSFLLEEYIFKLKVSECDVFGCCQRMVINPRRIPFFSSEKTMGYPYCLVVLSRVPCFAAHFEWLVYLAGFITRKWDPICPKVPKSISYSRVFEIEGLEVMNGVGQWRGTRYSEPLAGVVQKAFELQFKDERDQTITLAEDVTMMLPHKMNDIYYMAYSTMDVLFSALPVAEIVKLYTAMLLEHYVLFRSKSLHTLTFSLIAARCLLFPFSVEVIMLPIIPNTPEHLLLLDAPTPYIAGVVGASWDEFDSIPDGICLVDLDNGVVTDPEGEIELPDSAGLITALQTVLNDWRSVVTMPERITKEVNGKVMLGKEYMNFVERTSALTAPWRYLIDHPRKYVFLPPVVDAFLQIVHDKIPNKLENSLRPCLVTDSTDLTNPVTVLNDTLFASSIEKSEQAFYKAFMTTMIFETYSQGKTDETEMQKSLFNERACLNEVRRNPLLSGSQEIEIPSDLD